MSPSCPNVTPNNTMPIDVGVWDFFSGCGGTSLGLHRAGMKIVCGIDNDLDAANTFQHNFPAAQFVSRDIRSLGVQQLVDEVGLDTDFLFFSACAPCQPFTKQRTARQSGDARVPLLAELGRFIQKITPDLVLVENVPGFQKPVEDSSPLIKFLGILESQSYDWNTSIVEARAYGVPQRRSRLVLLASRHGDPGFPEPTHGTGRLPYSTVRQYISDLPGISAGGSHTAIKNHRAARLSAKNMQRIRATPEGGDRRDWPRDLWLRCHSGGYTGHTDVYGRMSWDMPATGLTTRCISYSNGRFGHPDQDRAISVREAANLQTFPTDFEFKGSLTSQARQIGNAMPVLLAEVLGRHLLSHLISKHDCPVDQRTSSDVT